MDPADVRAGLVVPNAAVALLGSGGAAATLVSPIITLDKSAYSADFPLL